MNSTVVVIDANTGDKLFEIPTDDKTQPSIINAFIDEDKKEIVLLGVYFKEGANIQKAKSKGLYVMSVDMGGVVKQQRHFSWAEDFEGFLDVNKKGKMDGGNYLMFHNIVRTDSGEIIAIGEQFSKKVDGGAIAAGAALSAIGAAFGGTSSGSGLDVMKMVIDDMVTFRLDKDLNLTAVDIFEKGKTDFRMDGATFASPQILATLANTVGAFDYSFTQHNEDYSLINIGYIDYDRKIEGKNKSYVGTINYADGELTQDKISLPNTRAERVRVLPAQPGYIFVAEYLKKEKKLDMNLVKINF